MEVQGRQPGGDMRECFDQTVRNRIREAHRACLNHSAHRREQRRSERETAASERTDELIQTVTEARKRRQADVLELSREGTAAAESDRNEARAELVVELRRYHEAGVLNTPERIERAAQRILGG